MTLAFSGSELNAAFGCSQIQALAQQSLVTAAHSANFALQT